MRVLGLILLEHCTLASLQLHMASHMDLSGLPLEMLIEEIVRRRGAVYFAQHAVTTQDGLPQNCPSNDPYSY